jgi:acyl-homoserine lactone acylase PvdQ
VRFTVHGPLISDALAAITSTIGNTIKDPLAFQWTASKPGHIVEAVLGLQQAHNWQEFR